MSESPVQALAQARGLPVLQPSRLRDPEFAEAFRALQPDLGVVARTASSFPKVSCLLGTARSTHSSAAEIPRCGTGASCGDRRRGETGVTIMRMEKMLDSGPMLAKGSTRLGQPRRAM